MGNGQWAMGNGQWQITGHGHGSCIGKSLVVVVPTGSPGSRDARDYSVSVQAPESGRSWPGPLDFNAPLFQ
jgi:hypothetical protein